MLQSKLGSKCPKIIRVYTEMLERQVFPIPRESTQSSFSLKGRQNELLDKCCDDISLHHLIRQRGNSHHGSIVQFDRLFKENMRTPERVTDAQVRFFT